MAAVRFKFSIDVVQSGQLLPPTLTLEQIRALGEAMVRGQKDRWSKGINAAGQTASPLARVTAKGKRTFGRRPIRDMEMTGLTVTNFSLRKADATGVIRAENTSRAARMHARKAQKFEQMIGISPQEKDALFRLAYRAYGYYIKNAWRPTRG